MASSSATSPSSVVRRKGEWTYDVFLSFRGRDTLHSFVDSLYAALVLNGIRVFKDDEKLGGGQPILEEHVKAIKESRIAVVVFSNNYANSSLCLEELSNIMECRDQMGHRVLPVFYHVDPSDVRNQNGEFATVVFQTHELKFKGEMDKVSKWREALTTAANLPGQRILPLNGDEAALISIVAEEISAHIQPPVASRGNNLIGKKDALTLSPVQTEERGWTYDVFLSFCASDTGNNFSDHLYAALDREPIHVFKHDYAGQTISEVVVKAIKESRIAVVVFSKNYANSSLCLEELSNIMECQIRMGGRKKVLPVFYHVHPSDFCLQEQRWIQKYITSITLFHQRVCKCMPWCERASTVEEEEEEEEDDALTAATNLPDPLCIPPDNTGESTLINMIVQQTLADVEINDRRIGKLFLSDKEIGKGSNGTIVLQGMYETRPVAVKCVLKSHHEVAKKEIKNLIESDDHPNIVRYYGFEENKDLVYIALKCCNCSLHELILSPTKQTVQSLQLTLEVNGYPSPELLKLMRDTVAGLAHLHKLGYIHRDVKPQNVLISKDNSSISAKVSDMGISKCLPADKSSLTSATGYGSSGWLAPETLCKERQTRAVDLFSYGCLLFFCITGGRYPFGDVHNMLECDINIKNDCKPINLSLVEHIPEALDLVSNLIQRNPESRPTAAEAYQHPLFWDSQRRLDFFREGSDYLEAEYKKNKNTNLQQNIQKIGRVAYAGRKWHFKLDSTLLKNIATGKPKRYKYNRVRDLIRLIRNMFNHYKELSADVQSALVNVPTGLDEYFRIRFPKLLMEVYKELKPYGNQEATLKKYYETTLVKHT